MRDGLTAPCVFESLLNFAEQDKTLHSILNRRILWQVGDGLNDLAFGDFSRRRSIGYIERALSTFLITRHAGSNST
jgi:hypothetical protein